MYAQTQHLYILPDGYKKLQDNPEDQISMLAERYFNAPQNSPPHHLPICELLSNFLMFSQEHLQEFASCALFSVLVDIHAENTNYSDEKLRELALEEILAFTLEIPNFHISCLTYEQALKCSEFVDEFYCEVADFYRFLFAPQPILQVTTSAAPHLSIIHMDKELGAEEQTEFIADTKNRASSRSRPTSKENTKQAEAEECLLAKPAFECTILSLDQGAFYQPPLPPTEEEIQEKELRHSVEEAEVEVKNEHPEAPELDVDKMAKAIELAAQQEFDKVRTKIMTELEGSKKPGKK